ncbi:MAG: response regulator, partial [Myxococcaceae bacterium]|nr:response regulator [Myxococcaceae bacterium]
GVLELEKGGAAPDSVQRLLRFAHTLKGAARVVKQVGIAERAHAIEEALAPLRDLSAMLERKQVDAVLALLDAVTAAVDALPSEARAPAARAPVKPAARELLPANVDVLELGALLSGIFETGVTLRGLKRHAALAARGRHLAAALADQLAPGRTPGAKAHAIAEELHELMSRLDARVLGTLEQTERELGQVREAAEQLQLSPAKLLFVPLERAARDAALALGRRVRFEGRGGAVRLGAAALAAVQPALVQAVRNAVAHGIEAPAAREARGKPAEGIVTVEVTRRGNRVTFVCADDGAGVDLAAVRAALGAKLPAGAGDVAVLEALLGSGVTTSRAATQQSGRGIGLDLVRDAAAQLGGEAKLETEAGRGTRVVLTVPTTAMAVEALLVEAGGVTAALPLEAVRRTIRLDPRDVSRTPTGELLAFDDATICLVPLTRLLRAKPSVPTCVLVIDGGSGLAALGVDRLIGSATVVSAPLPPLAVTDPVVAGASLDAEGVPRIVLDPAGLVAAALASRGAPPEGTRRARLPVLIIDDSITTRMLEQSILESAGYETDTATSGEEALAKARERAFGMFLVDVEMPGMDGVTFVERTRADPDLRHIPAILITSLADAADQERGLRAGASAYLVKSEFDQLRLLELIHRLVR